MPSHTLSRRDLLLQTAGIAAAATLDAAQAPSKPLVIDCHTHAGHAPGMLDPWSDYTDIQQTLDRNREAGIDKAVIFPISQDYFEKPNQEIADICRRHPGRFIGFAKHDPETEKGSIRKMLFHECRDLGLRGLKLHKHPGPEVLDAVAELGIPILYHPRRVALFDEIARNYPTVDLILAHLGSDLSADWREHLAAIEIARKYPNVYLDTGAVVMTRYIEQALDELGPAKIVYGSDEPELDCRLEIFKVRMLRLPEKQEQMILGGNMQRLLSKYKGAAA